LREGAYPGGGRKHRHAEEVAAVLGPTEEVAAAVLGFRQRMWEWERQLSGEEGDDSLYILRVRVSV
jgi:hypothetical protein